MNYYQHHIGDFNNATRHLTRIERSVYRDLIEMYYDREQPLVLSVDRLCRLVVAHSDEERTAVQQVLSEFFTETEQGWVHARCDREIAEFHSKKEKASASANARWKNTKSKTDAQRLQCDRITDAVSIDANQEPITNNQKEQELPAAIAPGNAVADQVDSTKQKAKRKTALPATFLLTTEMARWARERAPAANLNLETEKFCNHWRGKGETRADWVATWRTWMLNAQTFAERAQRPAVAAAGPDFESLAWTEEDLGI